MPTLTTISGYLFDATGAIIRNGALTLTLQQDMISLDGTKVAPFSVVCDLSPFTAPTPTVTPQGAPGAAAYSYKIVANDHDGNKTLGGTAGATATGNAALSVSNFNRITWAATANAASYDVFGRVAAGWQFIANTTALTYDDTGAITPSGGLPATNNTGGLVWYKVYATLGASPSGLAYFAEFDPNPSDTTKPARNKDGYWNNYWSVPNNVGPLPLGTFLQALRGQTSANYIPVGSEVTILGTPVYLGATPNAVNKRIVANQTTGNNPEVRYNEATDKWELSHDGTTFKELTKADDLTGTLADARLSSNVPLKNGANVFTAVQEFDKQYYSPIVNEGNSGTTKTIDWDLGNEHEVAMNGNCTFTLSNPKNGGRYVLILKQDATGSRVPTFPAAVLWPGGTTPTWSTAASKTDIVTLMYVTSLAKYLAAASIGY